MHNNIYASGKAKTIYNLGRREYLWELWKPFKNYSHSLLPGMSFQYLICASFVPTEKLHTRRNNCEDEVRWRGAYGFLQGAHQCDSKYSLHSKLKLFTASHDSFIASVLWKSNWILTCHWTLIVLKCHLCGLMLLHELEPVFTAFFLTAAESWKQSADSGWYEGASFSWEFGYLYSHLHKYTGTSTWLPGNFPDLEYSWKQYFICCYALQLDIFVL
jgi:hypothetical protein